MVNRRRPASTTAAQRRRTARHTPAKGKRRPYAGSMKSKARSPKLRLRRRKPVKPPQGTAGSWGERAYAAGAVAAASAGSLFADSRQSSVAQETLFAMNSLWSRWYATITGMPQGAYATAAARFVDAYCRTAGLTNQNWVLLPTEMRVAAIITIMNERDTLIAIINQLQRLPLHEIIFVVNGSNDDSYEIIRNSSRATIVHYHEPLGHDVGRAVGAKVADSDILLFLDGDFPILAEDLVPFVAGIARGNDIALNNISPYIGLFSARDDVTIVKEFMNRTLGRPDLEANSLTAVPHAMSRQAAQSIGYANLAVPPKAQSIAIERGMRIVAPTSVNVIAHNRVRSDNIGKHNAVADMIIGDHIEALGALLIQKGARLTYPDRIRRRE